MRHYDHLGLVIHRFFQSKGMKVLIEPHGSRGADLEGTDGTIMIGEIKNEAELNRDLGGYWSSWNSKSQQFGGKDQNFQLRSVLPDGVEVLSSQTKGWIAVIFGQLKYRVRKAGLTEGWVVYENYSLFESTLFEALNFLNQHNLTFNDVPEHLKGVGFVRVIYL
jgi:hypothetical protein